MSSIHFRASHPVQVVLCLAVAALASPAYAANCYQWEEVDVPGNDGIVHPGTSWWDVNNHDVFVGNYCVDAACSAEGGAIYDASTGQIEKFDVPGYRKVESPRINDLGVIAGGLWSNTGEFVSFVRLPSGQIKLLDKIPEFVGEGGINNEGWIAGFIFDFDGGTGKHAALVHVPELDRVYDYTVPGAVQDSLWGINDLGHVLPDWNMLPVPGGYLAGVDRNPTSVRGLGGIVWYNWADFGPYTAGTAWGLNNVGTVVGAVANLSTGDHPGFVDEGGELQVIYYNGQWTALLGVNDSGVIAATYDYYNRGLIGWPTACP